MLSLPHTVRIFLHTDAVDLRKSFDGLSGLVCQAFPEWKNRMFDRLSQFGEVRYDSVFAVGSKWARAEVLRVRPAT